MWRAALDAATARALEGAEDDARKGGVDAESEPSLGAAGCPVRVELGVGDRMSPNCVAALLAR